jgi:hypothetical protein
MSTTAEINATINAGMWAIAEHYAAEYKRNGKNFIDCFLHFPSVRTNCIWVRITCQRNGVMQEARERGKDFSEWVGKLKLDHKWAALLNDMLILIFHMNE